MKRVGDLEIDQDVGFEQRQWKIQRAGWVVMALIVVAALSGVFGSGPLSAATAGDEETLVVHYQRFVRHQGQGELVVKVGPNQASAGEVEFWITMEYLGEIDLQGISPEPDEVRSAGDRQVFVFLVDDPAQPLEVTITYFPNGLGRVSGAAGLLDGASVSFTQFGYP
ncbi:MAG: hypothetical protein M3457_22490 [Chloroflexota bacterium]|nr:hypothetical protein [Chloroflexota bacterium]